MRFASLCLERKAVNAEDWNVPTDVRGNLDRLPLDRRRNLS